MKRKVLVMLTAAATLFASALVPVGSAHATPIDDFEQGPFVYQTTVSAGGTQSGLSPLHCIASQRNVTFTSYAGGMVGGQLDLTNPMPDHEVATVFTDGGGSLTFGYPLPAGADLTGGGQFGLLFVHVTTAEPGAELSVYMIDGSGVGGSDTVPVSGPNFYLFAFADIGALDFTDITDIRVVLDTPVLGDFHISDIRLGSPDMMNPMEFGVVAGDIAGPPYPTEAILFDGSARITEDQAMLLSSVDLKLRNVTDMATGGPVMILGLGEDSSPGPDDGAIAMVTLHDTGLPDMTSFEVLVDVYDHGEYLFMPSAVLEPMLVSEQGFLLPMTYEVYTMEMMPVGTLRQDLLFEIPSGAPYTMSDVSATPEEPAHVAFVLNRTAARSEGDGDGRFVEIRITGAFGEAPTVGVGGVPDVSASVFRAIPTVTTRGTLFSLGGARAHDAAVSLFDVAGRSVRTLALAAGRASVAWDGRDGAGRRVAPGIYIARVTGGSVSASARVVKIR